MVDCGEVIRPTCEVVGGSKIEVCYEIVMNLAYCLFIKIRGKLFFLSYFAKPKASI